MGDVDRPIAALRGACRLLDNVVRKLREPAQPRVLRLEPCQPAAAVRLYDLTISHVAPPPPKDARPGEVTLRQVGSM
jgi:hypothetical protein